MPHLFTTETKNYRPLDRRNDYPWEILRDRLVRELGREFATLLAEPVARAGEGFVDWYTESTKPAIPAGDLSESDRDNLYKALQIKRHRVFELADKIEGPGRRDADKRFADAIRRAMIVPSDERFVWSLGGEPTLLLWGMLNVDDEREIEDVLVAVRNPRGPRVRVDNEPALPPELPPPPPEKKSRSWLLSLPLWLLFIALVGAIYYLLLVNCDVAIGPRTTLLQQFGINACTSTFATTDGALRRQQLQERIQQAELDLARVQGDCEPPVPPYRPDPPPPPPQPRPGPGPTREDICTELQRRGVACRPDAKLQVSLGWNTLDDLDLRVECPGGGEFYRGDDEACGGRDYRDTIRPTPNSNSIENGAWINPPRGRYRIKVELYTKRSPPNADVPFTIIVKCGDQFKEIRRQISRQSTIAPVLELDYPACQLN